MKALEEKQGKTAKNGSVEELSQTSESSNTSDSDFGVYDSAPSSSKQRKRKLHKPEDGPTKKQKVEYTTDVIYNYFLEQVILDFHMYLQFTKKIQIITDICDKTLLEHVKRKSVEAQTSNFQDIQSKEHLIPGNYFHYDILDTNAKMGNDQTKNALDGTKIVEKKSLNFPPMDLEKFESADELEQLGLDHLKHALESKCLICRILNAIILKLN